MKYVKRNIIKGYKPIVIKYLALFIGVCYLANPLQSQVGSIFHEISHIFEAPDTPIGHSTASDKQNVVHHYQEHTHSDNQHEHTLIDMLNSIFNATDDGSQEESVLVEVKFDKHISTDQYLIHKIYSKEKSFNFISKENNLIKGHFSILEEPPQSLYL